MSRAEYSMAPLQATSGGGTSVAHAGVDQPARDHTGRVSSEQDFAAELTNDRLKPREVRHFV
jgi:hypothetical protein